jgi:hypothetical protein
MADFQMVPKSLCIICEYILLFLGLYLCSNEVHYTVLTHSEGPNRYTHMLLGCTGVICVKPI